MLTNRKMDDYLEDYKENTFTKNQKYFYCKYCGYRLGTEDLGMINIMPNSPTGLHIKIVVGAVTCPECGKTSEIK